ncbi:MAG: hypothetical protein AABY01_01465 [Nanoarchaeota archaeon]
MRLAFWNNGSPKEVDPQRVKFPNGDVAYDAAPDQKRDLYEFLPTTDLPCHPWQTRTVTYELIGGKIKEIQFCTWPPVAELTAKKKAQITAERRKISSGSIIVGGLVVQCTDGNISELEVLVSQAARGRVVFPVKATTAAGKAFLINNSSEVQVLLDAIQTHRQAARNTEYDHLIAIENITDERSIADYNYMINWPSIIGN